MYPLQRIRGYPGSVAAAHGTVFQRPARKLTKQFVFGLLDQSRADKFNGVDRWREVKYRVGLNLNGARDQLKGAVVAGPGRDSRPGAPGLVNHSVQMDGR